MNLRDAMKRNPLISYFLIAFGIAWILCLIFVAPRFLRGEEIGFSQIVVLFLSMLGGPSIASLVMTAVTGGRKGLSELFSRVKHSQVGWKWYAALLIFPVLITVVLFGLSLTVSPVFSPVFLAIGLIFGLFAGFFEELGWSGFAYPRMREKFGWVNGSLILGAVWMLWHLLPDFLGAYTLRGSVWLPHFIGFVFSMMCVRFLLSWGYNHTKSVLLCQLMHASSTGFLGVLVPATITPAQDTLVYYVYGAALLIVVVVLVVREKKSTFIL